MFPYIPMPIGRWSTASANWPHGDGYLRLANEVLFRTGHFGGERQASTLVIDNGRVNATGGQRTHSAYTKLWPSPTTQDVRTM